MRRTKTNQLLGYAGGAVLTLALALPMLTMLSPARPDPYEHGGKIAALPDPFNHGGGVR